MTDPTGTGVRQTLAYHERTKHHLHRYARGPGHLDWATQPDPFRRFPGAPAVELPLLARNLATLYGDLYVPGAIAPRALGWDAVAVLFELALGLSAWKAKDLPTASKWFEAVTGDKEVPAGARQRAEVMLQLIAGDAPPKAAS